MFSKASVSHSVHVGGLPSRGVCIRGRLPQVVSVCGGSASEGSLHPEGLPLVRSASGWVCIWGVAQPPTPAPGTDSYMQPLQLSLRIPLECILVDEYGYLIF